MKFCTYGPLDVQTDFGSFSCSLKIQYCRYGSHFEFLSNFFPDYSSETKHDRDMGFSLLAMAYLFYVPLSKLEIYDIQNGRYYGIRIKCFPPKFQLSKMDRSGFSIIVETSPEPKLIDMGLSS